MSTVRNSHSTATAQTAPSTTRAKLVTASNDNLQLCADRLRAGKLVAFPTETVYGLGAHALDETAIRAVFTAKKRPWTDPLIVHVLDAPAAFVLWRAKQPSWEESSTLSSNDTYLAREDIDGTVLEGRILWRLCQTFWPGPLTLVARATTAAAAAAAAVHGSFVPDLLMAGTGFVACRSPAHATARALLSTSQLSLAAPSANTFGHVSPTTARHVWDDLQTQDVWILAPEETVETNNENGTAAAGSCCCPVGVESTVAKLDVTLVDEHGIDGPRHEAVLTVLRQGAVSVRDLRECLQDIILSQPSPQFSITVQTKHRTVVSDAEATVAPGQSIRHYSPNIPSYMVSVQLQERLNTQSAASFTNIHCQYLARAVIVDFGQALLVGKHWALDYRDLSPSASSSEAAQVVFETLRWAEQVPGATLILLANLDGLAGNKDDALALAIQDRLTRAASGVVVEQLDELLSN